MKKIALFLFALMVMVAGAMAQENNNRGEGRRAPQMNKETMVKNMTDRQVKRLKLNDQQTEQMKVLNTAYVDELMASMPQMPGFGQNRAEGQKQMTAEEREAERKKRQKRMEEMQNNYVTLVKAILTEEQFVEFEKMQKERPQMGNRQGQRGQRGGQRGGGNFGGGPRGGGNFGGGQPGGN